MLTLSCFKTSRNFLYFFSIEVFTNLWGKIGIGLYWLKYGDVALELEVISLDVGVAVVCISPCFDFGDRTVYFFASYELGAVEVCISSSELTSSYFFFFFSIIYFLNTLSQIELIFCFFFLSLVLASLGWLCRELSCLSTITLWIWPSWFSIVFLNVAT